MKAAVVNTLSQPPRYEEFAEPLAGEGEAIVAMQAVGLHPIVKALASGQHYSGKGEVPFIAGVDWGGETGRWKHRLMNAILPLFSLAAGGHLRVAVESVPLADVAAAWTRIEKGKRIVFSI